MHAQENCTHKEMEFGFLVVFFNSLWIASELILAGLGIEKLHSWKVELDATEPYDSLYISYIALYFGILILSVCLIAVIFEVIANVLLIQGLRMGIKSYLNVFIVTTCIVTVLSTVGAIIFHTANGYYLFGDSIKHQMAILAFWSSKIVYSVVATIFVFKRRQYAYYAKASNQPIQ